MTVVANRFRARQLYRKTNKYRGATASLRVLDIGCGRGNLLKALHKFGFECHGTERSGFLQSGNNTHPEIQIHYKSPDKLDLPAGYFDLIVIWHVLEHLNEPLDTLDIANHLLAPGGIIAVSVPNYGSIQSAMFKSHWFHLDIPRHLYHFTPHSLESALISSGFKPLSTNTCSVEQGTFGLIQSLFNAIHGPGRPNEFYNVLKGTKNSRQLLILISGLAGSIILLPIALMELILSCILRRGAVITMIAQKFN